MAYYLIYPLQFLNLKLLSSCQWLGLSYVHHPGFPTITQMHFHWLLPQYYNRKAVCDQIILSATVPRITRSRCWSAYTAFRNSLLGAWGRGETDNTASVYCHSGTWEGLNCFFLSEGYLWELVQFRKRHWCETCVFFSPPSSWSPHVKELSLIYTCSAGTELLTQWVEQCLGLIWNYWQYLTIHCQN